VNTSHFVRINDFPMFILEKQLAGAVRGLYHCFD